MSLKASQFLHMDVQNIKVQNIKYKKIQSAHVTTTQHEIP